MLYPRGSRVDQMIVNHMIVVTEAILQDVEMVPPAGETLHSVGVVPIHQGPLVLIEMADNTFNDLPMVTYPPDLRRERTVAIETEDEIVQETDARWIKQVNNNSALVLIRAQGLVLNVMAWGTSSPTALAPIGI